MIESSIMTPRERRRDKCIVIVDLSHVFNFTYNMHFLFNLEDVMEKIAIIIGKNVYWKNFMGYIYFPGHLAHLRNDIKILARKRPDLSFIKLFKIKIINQMKMIDGKHQYQDMDTYVVAKAMEKLVKSGYRTREFVLVGGDLDMLPVIHYILKKNIPTTIIGHEKSISVTVRKMVHTLYLKEEECY